MRELLPFSTMWATSPLNTHSGSHCPHHQTAGKRVIHLSTEQSGIGLSGGGTASVLCLHPSHCSLRREEILGIQVFSLLPRCLDLGGGHGCPLLHCFLLSKVEPWTNSPPLQAACPSHGHEAPAVETGLGGDKQGREGRSSQHSEVQSQPGGPVPLHICCGSMHETEGCLAPW